MSTENTADDELDPAKLEKILGGVRIPPQPKLLLELKEETSKATPNINKICTLISKDVSLSAGVLKTINSPFYGLSRKCESIQRATVILGMRNVSNLVRALSLQGTFNAKKVSLERFWDTAADVANICVAIASRLQMENPDEYYSVGLFHDCGIAVLAQKFDNYKDVLKAGNALVDQPITHAEDLAYDTNHTVVGYYLGKSWNLSDVICKVIQMHHDIENMFPETEPVSGSNQMMAILKAAGNISHNNRRLSDDHEWLRIREQVLHHLTLDETEYNDMRDDIAEMLQKAAAA